MNNQVGLLLAAVLVAIFLADSLVFHWDLQVVLGKALIEAVEYMAFWR